eukprot:403338154
MHSLNNPLEQLPTKTHGSAAMPEHQIYIQENNNSQNINSMNTFTLADTKTNGSSILVDQKYQIQVDQKEYGGYPGNISSNLFQQDPVCQQRLFPISQVQFNPREIGIMDRYVEHKLIYNELISSTKILLTKDIQNDRDVIKKVIVKDKLCDQKGHDFAIRECALHSQLHHENIVKLFDYTETKQDYILYMEYCDKADYLPQKILECHTPINNTQKLQSYAQDTLEGLSYIHNQGVIHHDIKLENLLMESSQREDEYNSIKICDFGLAHILDQSTGKSLVEVKCGTMGYIAPEISPGNYIGPEIDIWALGVVLYEMAAAYKPTQYQNYRYGSGPIPFRRLDWRNRGKHLQDLIQQCLEFNPSKRLTAQEALQHPFFEEDVAIQ